MTSARRECGQVPEAVATRDRCEEGKLLTALTTVELDVYPAYTLGPL